MRGLVGHRERLAPPLPHGLAAPASPLVDACRRAGLHLTPRRRALLVVFEEADEPICVEVFFDRLRARGLRTSRSTLYKFVADLLEAGVLIEILGRDRRRYRASDAR